MPANEVISNRLGLHLPVAVPESSRLIDAQKIKQSLEQLDELVYQHGQALANVSSNVTDIPGNAATATLAETAIQADEAVKLKTVHYINGNPFDGTQDVSFPIVDTTAIHNNLINVPNGVLGLDSTGKVPPERLPSFVDDVIEAADFASLPVTGESGKLYITTNNDRVYRWTGSQYTNITSAGVNTVNGRSGVVVLTSADVGLGNVNNTSDANKPVSTAQQTAIDSAKNTAISTAAADATAKANTAETNAKALSAPIGHVGAGGAAHALATTVNPGFLSNTDKVKLDNTSGINTGDQTNIPGNAATATKLQTARTINGVSFDGTSDITINAVDSTARLASSEKGAVNGVATLDATGKIPAGQLPSYVDDVVEYANQASLPATGESGKIYITLDNNYTYRWSGSQYVSLGSAGGGSVTSVNGKTGIVVLAASDISGISTVGKTGAYTDVTGRPTKLSDFTNDLNIQTGGSLKATVPGTITPFVGTLKNYPKDNITITNMVAWVADNVTTDLVVNVLKNGAIVKTLTIVNGTSKVSASTSVAMTPNDYVTINVSSGTGSDLVVRLDY